MTEAPPLLLADTAGPVTTLTMNRPEKRNALNVALLEQLIAAIVAAENLPEQRVLVLKGAGAVFCAGLDLTEAAAGEAVHRSAQLIAKVLLALSASRLVTIASVQGAAIAGGAGLMSACDWVAAAAGTQIGYPETRRGLVAGLVMTFLRRQLRERDARELLLTGELIAAERALAVGLVNRVVPADTLAAEVARFIGSVLQGGPEAVANTKRLWSELWPRPLPADLERALDFHLSARQSAEAHEGMMAFREKRRPRWSVGP